MRTLLRDVIVLLSGGLTWEPGAGLEPDAGRSVRHRLRGSTSTVVPGPLTMQGAPNSPTSPLPGR